jgi:hypothetical protein
VSIGVTDRVVTGLVVADVARWRLDSPAGTELCDPQQVVGGADQVGGETSDAAVVCRHAAEDRGAAVAGGIRRAQSRADFDDKAGAQGGVSAESSGKSTFSGVRAR